MNFLEERGEEGMKIHCIGPWSCAIKAKPFEIQTGKKKGTRIRSGQAENCWTFKT